MLVAYGRHIQAQDVLGQAGFLSVNDKRPHFGLGRQDKVSVEIRWPSGVRQRFDDVETNHLITIDEIKGQVAKQRFESRAG